MIEEILAEGGDADEVLRAVVVALVEQAGFDWAGILFNEDGELVLGPHAGTARPERRSQLPVTYGGGEIAQLVADGGDPAILEQVAPRIALHCLVGWDTGGVPWDELA